MGHDLAYLRIAPSLSVAQNKTIALRGVVSSAAFGWASLVLPIDGGSILQWLSSTLSLLHAIAFGLGIAQLLAAGKSGRGLGVVGGLLAICSLGAAAYFLFALATTSYFLVNNYGQLGWGLSALLAMTTLVLQAMTLPVAHFWWQRFKPQCRV